MRSRLVLFTTVVVLLGLVLPFHGALAQSEGALRPVVRFEGVVESRPTETKLGEWHISGQTVIVVEATHIVEIRGEAIVGARVLVIAKRLESGTLEAIQIHVLQPAVVTVKIRGLVTELNEDDKYLVVNGLKITYNDDTEIVGELKVDAFVKIEATMTPTAYTATKIEVVPGPRLPKYVEFEGEIKKIDDAENKWLVDGREITITALTVIIGVPAEGKQAEVRALEQSDGALMALWIRIKEEPEVVTWKGRIDRLPWMRWGFWIVDGRAVLVTPATEITGITPAEGKHASVEAVRQGFLPLQATKILVEEPPSTSS